MKEADRQKAFNILLDKILGYAYDEEITIIYDESFEKYLPVFTTIVNHRGIVTNFFFLPISFQKILMNKNRLSSSIKASFSEAEVFLNAINGDKAATPLRKMIIKEMRNKNSRLAHMPDLDDELLNLLIKSEPKIPEIKLGCEKMAWAMGQAQKLTITTEDAAGNTYQLLIDQKVPWVNDPIVSHGVIEKESWGNPIPGETFICPQQNHINGSICINGSVPDHPLKKGEDVILAFDNGRLTNYFSAADSPALHFFDAEKNRAENAEDKNWNCFAELGIGLNPMISELNGNMLYDEKIAGTIHVAIGDNNGFGFDVSAKVHHDLVIQRAKVVCNDHYEIISDGSVQFPIIDNWRNTLRPRKLSLHDSDMITINHQRIQIKNGLAQLKIVRAGRVSYITICSRNWIKGVKALLLLIPEGKNFRLGNVEQKYRSRGLTEDLHTLLELLSNYKIIYINGLGL